MTPGPEALRDAAILRAIVEGVEAQTGDAFFASLVRHVATALGVQYVFASELTQAGTHFRSRAVWARGARGEDFEVPLRGTPCEAVLGGELVHHPERLQQHFPDDAGLGVWGVVSYCGAPIAAADGSILGHIAVLDDRPMPDATAALAVLRIFAARAAAEIERLQAFDALRTSEEQLRQVLRCAADGIIVSDEDGRILLFNPAAERIFGCTAAQAIGEPVARFGTPDGVAARQQVIAQLALDPKQVVFYGEDQGILARRFDGTPFLHEGSLSRSESGGQVFYTGIVRDCEERRGASRELDALRRQNETLREELRSLYAFDAIVGGSSALRDVLEQVERVATTDASVLIRGESGTGKELIARAIHSLSARREHPMIRVNCAALSGGLVESELFGHEKGAFTGASERRIGRFELADGGTIFLDEVGEIPESVQVKLLRVLQEREFERVGGTRTIRVDVRILAATNRDLERAIAARGFREDLYYRLAAFPVRVPPLRERREDIPLLVDAFIDRYAAKIGRPVRRASAATLERLCAYAWPGNVRELENVIERALILSRGAVLEVAPELLPASAVASPPQPNGAPHASDGMMSRHAEASRSLKHAEREHILAALDRCGWKIEGDHGAAAALGLRPSTLRSRMQKLAIQRAAS